MKSFVVFNNKGGVGKTTLLCNLASYLALKKEKKVLVIDADPQCNASTYLINLDDTIEDLSKDKLPSIIKIIKNVQRGDGYIKKEDIPILKSNRFGVDIIYGDTRLSLLEDFLSTDWSSSKIGDVRGLKTTLVFYDLLQNLKDDYDYIFFDVGPSLGAINRIVLVASDFFIMPMSSDIFSLRAIGNIAESLKTWTDNIIKGLSEYEDANQEEFKLCENKVGIKLKFLGYVNQQYTAKAVGGVRRPVKAYERIIERIPNEIAEQLSDFYDKQFNVQDLKLGDVPNYNSLIPLSQLANSPIFSLTGSDGVVGAHFAKVKEFEEVMKTITENIIKNIEYYDNVAE